MAAKSNKKANRSPVEKLFDINTEDAENFINALTERERQVAMEMATGMSNEEIAKKLGISPKTLDIHRSNVRYKLDKLELPSRTAIDVARYVWVFQLSNAN